MESAKWIGAALFFVGSLGRRIAEKRNGWRKPDPFEWLIIGMWLTPLLSTVANWPLPNGISGLKDTSMYLLIGWLMYTNNYSESQIKTFLFVLIGGIMLGLAWSAWNYFTGQNPYLEFKSIPNLNRSVIYHLISIFIMSGVLLDNTGRFTTSSRIAISGCFIASIIGLIIMGSRGGILGFLAGAGFVVVSLFKQKRVWSTFVIGITVSVAVMTIVGIAFENPKMTRGIKKFTRYYEKIRNEEGLESMITGSERDRYDYIRVAWAQITQQGHMVLGSGPRTFKYIDIEKLMFDKPLMVYKATWDRPTHAHNEFLTRWVEVGLVGLSIHLFFLGFVAKSLIRHRPGGKKVDWHWIACMGFLSVSLVSGLFNSVLTNEMGWLSMMIIGLSMKNFKNISVIHQIKLESKALQQMVKK